MCDAVKAGLNERKIEKDKEEATAEISKKKEAKAEETNEK